MDFDAVMKDYTDAIKEKYSRLYYSTAPDDAERDADEWPDIMRKEKERIHSVAIECLNKILTPELKVFVRNLCYNNLGYPEEPIFYEIFGDYPEIGDKAYLDDLIERNVDLTDIDSLIDLWCQEGNWVEEDIVDGKKAYVIKLLYESEVEDSEERLRKLRSATKLKKFLLENSGIEKKDKENMIEMMDDLLFKKWKI